MKPFFSFLLSAIMLVCANEASASVIYVDIDATGANTGASWTDAYTSLQSALGSAAFSDEIWIAEGTYLPTNTTDRTITFTIPSGVKVYGGFAGNETALDQRDWNTHLSILSGDIGTPNVNTDNTNRVVTTAGVSSATQIDGVRIMNGYYVDNTIIYSGAGFNNTSGSPVIRNCTFEANTAGKGGAFYQSAAGNALIEHCTFLNNNAMGPSTATGGGAISITGGLITLNDCVMQSNTGRSGGAIYLNGGELRLNRCDITGNSATTTAGAIYGFNYDFSVTLANCLIAGNYSGGTVSAIYLVSTPSHIQNVYNCTIADNHAQSLTVSACVLNGISHVTNSIIKGNDGINQLSVPTGLIDHNIIVGVVDGPAINGSLVDPQFINDGTSSLAPFTSENYDYHVPVLSNAIDFGSISLLQTGYDLLDAENNARVAGASVDAGCYEKNYCTYSPVITSSQTAGICPGQTVTLSAGSPNQIQWSNGSSTNTIDISNGGTYSFVADSAGCLGSASFTAIALSASVNIDGPEWVCIGSSGSPIVLSAIGGIFETILWSTGANTPSINVSGPSTISVTVTTPDGCVATDSQQVSLAFPAPANITGDPTVCVGSSNVLTALVDGVTNYLWSPGGQNTSSIDVSSAGTYNVQLTSPQGCVSTDEVIVTTVDAPTPIATYASGLLSTTSFASYQWMLNGVAISDATSFFYTPLQNGVYSVQVTNADGCGNDSPPVNVTGIVGVAEIGSSIASFYPNPFNDELNIQLAPSIQGVVNVAMRDLNGRLVYALQNVSTPFLRIPTSALASGVYTVQLMTSESTQSFKAVK